MQGAPVARCGTYFTKSGEGLAIRDAVSASRGSRPRADV